MYCVYLTTYSGDKLPKYYIGSSSIKNIENGYHGSVSSKEFKSIWEDEILNNKHLFKTEIISIHDTRIDASIAELEQQKLNNVVESLDYINKSYAIPNGFFGMDVSGKNNPMYGKNRTGEKHKGGENISKALKEFFNSDKSINHRTKSKITFTENNPASNPEIFKKIKETWKQNGRNVGEKNPMYGKPGAMVNKVLYNNGVITKAYYENEQPENWVKGRHKRTTT